MFGWFKRVRGISTPLGGLSWAPAEKTSKVPQFDGAISLTSQLNDEVISFLERNVERIVYLNATIDASAATEEQAKFVDSRRIDINSLVSGDLGEERYELRNKAGNLIYLSITLLPSKKLRASHGGTGVTTLAIRGFFEIESTHQAGPSIVFHLRELEAPLDAKLEKVKR